MRRINFQLPKNLAIRFEQEAFKKGITKAKLLRGWIESVSVDQLIVAQIENDFESTSFNMRVSDNVYEKLVELGLGLNQIQSQVLRKVVASNLKSNQINKTYTELWQLGDLRNIYRITDFDFEKLPFNERLHYLRLQVEKGDFYDVERKLDGLGDEVWKLVIQADLQTYCFGDDSSNVLSRIQAFGGIVSLDEHKKAELNRAIGRLYFLHDELIPARNYLNKAFDIFSLKQDKIGLINTSMYLSSIYNYLLEIDLSKGYGELLKRMIGESSNIHFEARVMHNLSVNEFRRGNLAESKRYEVTSLKLNELNDSGIGKIYSYDNLAWISFFEQDKSACRDYVSRMNKAKSFSFVKNKSWHSDVLGRFSSGNVLEIDQLHTLRRCVTNYLLAASGFIKGDSSSQKKSSADLKKLAQIRKLPILQNAVKKTLETKQLVIFR